MKKSEFKKLVKETLEEISTSGGLAGYSTPFAFSKEKNKATKYLEKQGMQVVKLPKKSYNTKMFDYKRHL